MLSQVWINMVKVLSSRFKQCFGAFTMLVVEGCSGTGRFRHLSNLVFQSPSFHKHISYEGHPFLKMLKIKSKFTKCKRKLRKGFRFWDNSIWKCWNKLDLLGREYLSSAVNELTKSPKILHIIKRDFFDLNFLPRYQ